jgi:hypothetical protein
MNLKNLSIACLTTAVSIGIFSLPSQAATKRETFFYGLIAVLKSAPHLPGDDNALEVFATMNDDAKDKFFNLGKTYCASLLLGKSSDQFVTDLKQGVNNMDASESTKQALWSLELASISSAKRNICPAE